MYFLLNRKQPDSAIIKPVDTFEGNGDRVHWQFHQLGK